MKQAHNILLNRHSTLVGLIFLFLVHPLFVSAQVVDSHDPTPRTNLEIIRNEIILLTGEMIEKSSLPPGENLYVKIQPSDTSWVFRNTLLEALKHMRYNIFLLAEEKERGARAELGLIEAKVRYGRSFRENFLGKRKTGRTIKVALSGSLRNPDGEIVFAGTLFRSFSDTVYVGDLPELENPSMPFTQGETPQGGFFDSVLEPLVIIGASAVAIYLFFTIRS